MMMVELLFSVVGLPNRNLVQQSVVFAPTAAQHPLSCSLSLSLSDGFRYYGVDVAVVLVRLFFFSLSGGGGGGNDNGSRKDDPIKWYLFAWEEQYWQYSNQHAFLCILSVKCFVTHYRTTPHSLLE